MIQSGGAETFTMPPITAAGPYSAVAVSSEDCKEGRTTEAGCSVYVNTVGARSQAWVSTSHGFADRVGGGIRRCHSDRGARVPGRHHRVPQRHDHLLAAPGRARRRCAGRPVTSGWSGSRRTASTSSRSAPSETASVTASWRSSTPPGTRWVHLVSTQASFTSSLDQIWEDDTHVLTGDLPGRQVGRGPDRSGRLDGVRRGAGAGVRLRPAVLPAVAKLTSRPLRPVRPRPS